MGRLKNGASGAVTGKVGGVVTYELRGQTVARKVGTRKFKATANQLPCREGMRVVNAFLKPIKGLINLGFLFEAEGTTKNQYNVATSYILLNALKGKFPNISIDYDKVMISAGKLKPISNPSVSKSSQSIRLDWTYDSNTEFANRNDRTMILLIFSNGDEPIYFLSGSLRSEENQIIDLGPKSLSGSFHIYVCFFAEDRASVSDSKYLYIA
ncbi:MAG: DUF6266 family protein [Pedobacter sp.]